MTSYYAEQELKAIGLKSYGSNVKISRKASIYGAESISIGSNVRIDDFSILSGSIDIGSFVHIAAYSALFAGSTDIEMMDYSGLSSRVVVYAESDDYGGDYLTNPTVGTEYTHIIKGKVTIKKHAIIGTSSVILPGVTIGEGVAVGSMSLINKSLDDWTICFGVPCKSVKNRHKYLLKLEERMNMDDFDKIIGGQILRHYFLIMLPFLIKAKMVA